MPVPQAILSMGKAAKNVGQFRITFNNPKTGGHGPRGTLTRTFHAYLEIGMQGKHCALMRGYCKKIGITGRKQDGKQVPVIDATPEVALAANGYYGVKGRKACEVAQVHMVGRWQAQAPGGAPVFAPGTRVDAAVQKFVQSDAFQYEVSYWYDAADIYVLFHCYPSR